MDSTLLGNQLEGYKIILCKELFNLVSTLHIVVHFPSEKLGYNQRMEGFPLDAICADYRTGRHFYDGEATMPEEEGDGVRDFFRNALKQHEMRNKIEK